MTNLEFQSECGIRLISVDIALEDTEITQALINRDDKKVIELLDNNF